MPLTRFQSVCVFCLVCAASVTPAPVAAQGAQPAAQVTLPPVTVSAQKEPADPQTLPVSLTPVPLDALWNGGMTTIGEASIYAPNTFFTDFTARKLSNPRFRGIGSSPSNPAISTYIDGVPQLNTNSSSIELLDVAQLEFVRGPESSLFGRNTLGGVVNISSVRPSLSRWTGSAVVPLGNYSAIDVRGDASGPLGKKAAVGFAIGHSQRDGFTKNGSGHAVDSRDATFGKAQFLLTPSASWDLRFIYTGERARDGDYALNDLGSLRQAPFRTARDFEGHTNRDLNSTTFIARHETSRVSFTSTTGFVHWKTDDLTDLDYTPLPLLTRSNAEKDSQFTEEARIASAASAPVKLHGGAALRWQAGVFLFTQNYDQDAVNTFAPFVLSPFLAIPTHQHSPQSSLDDNGIGVYGMGSATLHEKLDLTLGARVDHENRKGTLATFFVEPFFQQAPPVKVDRSFSNVSPEIAVAYRARPNVMPYFSVSGGYKAGGFNPASPAGSEAYGEEHTWNYEGGIKTAWMQRRVTLNASVFSIDWQDLQLNLPNTAVPGQFYIANVGSARSNGFELEMHARAHRLVEVFGTFGYTDARFGSGTTSSGANVSDNKVPNTPDYTASLGAQISADVGRSFKCYGRGEAVFYGAFKYDDLNSAGQDAYSLANFRAGARARFVFVEGWVRNAFDTKYVPVAFAYDPRLAPSGFLGEMGRPRTFGVTAGVSF